MTKNSTKSIQIKVDLNNPSELAKTIFTKISRGKLTSDDLAKHLGEPGVASSLIAGSAVLIRDLADNARATQKQQAENLAVGLQLSLLTLQEVGRSLETDDAKLRFAQTVADLSKQYFTIVKEMSDDANNLWKYTIGGVIALGIAVIGGQDYLRGSSTKDDDD